MTQPPSLLTGLVFDETGDKLSPTHTVKNGRRYRYYISHRLMHDKRNDAGGWRIPASELEICMTNAMTQILSDELQLIEMIQITECTIQLMSSLRQKASNLVNQLTTGDDQEKRAIIHCLVKHIKLSDDKLAIDLSRRELISQLLPPDSSLSNSHEGSDDCSITLPFTLKRRGVEAKLIIGLNKETAACVDDNLVRVITKSHAWFDALSKGQAHSIRHLAETEGVSENDISRSLQLAFLAPSIIEKVLAGKQSVELTSQTLKRVGDLPFCWHRQSNQFGCH